MRPPQKWAWSRAAPACLADYRHGQHTRRHRLHLRMPGNQVGIQGGVVAHGVGLQAARAGRLGPPPGKEGLQGRARAHRSWDAERMGGGEAQQRSPVAKECPVCLREPAPGREVFVRRRRRRERGGSPSVRWPGVALRHMREPHPTTRASSKGSTKAPRPQSQAAKRVEPASPMATGQRKRWVQVHGSGSQKRRRGAEPQDATAPTLPLPTRSAARSPEGACSRFQTPAVSTAMPCIRSAATSVHPKPACVLLP